MNDNKNEYRCVTDPAAVKAYLGDAKIVSFDYETAPDDGYRNEDKAALDAAKSHICTLSLSVREHTGIMIPVAHKVGPNMPKAEFDALLVELLTDRTIIKVAHNLSFEAMFSYAKGIVIMPPVYDTIAASQMTLKNAYDFRKLSDSGLKNLAKELCGEPLPSFSSVTDGKHFDDLDSMDEETIRYSCADSDFALPMMQERKAEADAAMERIRSEIAFMIGDVNIGSNCSTNAFKSYLFNDLRLPVLKTTESNREAADDATMIMLKEWCDTNRPELSHLFELVQEYRKWNKIASTYIDGYMKYINPATGRIHPNFYALSTDTGRFSCSSPNLQNAPRKTNDPIGVRNFIKAPEGCLIVSCDYSQIELRVGAHYCQDDIMLETYRTGGDIHAATTSVIFNIPYAQAQDKHAENYKERRTIAKNVNFGTFYGLFPRGLQKTLKFKAWVEKTVEECQEIIANLKAGYPALVTWQEETKADAYRKMYSETRLGRRRYLPGIRSEDWGKKSFAERCSMNTPIQGTAADILKLALGRILFGLPERPWLKPILQIHDELTFIIPEDKLTEAVAFIKDCMESQPFPEFDLPLVAEASAGPAFGQMEELED